MLDENILMRDLNEAFRNLQRGNVRSVVSITINFPLNEDGTLSDPTFAASGGYDDGFEFTTVKLDVSPEMKIVAKSLKEKAEAQLGSQKSILKDKVREVLIKAATEV